LSHANAASTSGCKDSGMISLTVAMFQLQLPCPLRLLDVYGHFMPTESAGFTDAITAPNGT